MNSNDSSTAAATIHSNSKSSSNDDNMLVLQPYLEAAATCQNAAAMRAVVSKVLQEPELFAGYDQIKAALLNASAENNNNNSNNNPTEVKALNTLDLFSYGTVTDYQQAAPDTYMALSHAQQAKLRQLTVLTLIENACLQHQDTVPYTAIHQALLLDVNNNNNTEQQNHQQQLLRETEQILAQLLAARVVTGKLSQKKAALLLKSSSSNNSSSSSNSDAIMVRPRDVHPATVARMLQALQQMRVRLTEANDAIRQQQTDVLKALDNENVAIQQAATTGGDMGQHEPYMLEQILYSNAAAAAAARPLARRQKRSRGGFTSNNNSSGSSSSAPEPPPGGGLFSRPFGL